MECNIDAFYVILFSYAFIFYYSINIYYYHYRMIFLYSNIKIDTMRTHDRRQAGLSRNPNPREGKELRIKSKEVNVF